LAGAELQRCPTIIGTVVIDRADPVIGMYAGRTVLVLFRLHGMASARAVIAEINERAIRPSLKRKAGNHGAGKNGFRSSEKRIHGVFLSEQQ
jgi:hypothetical protein